MPHAGMRSGLFLLIVRVVESHNLDDVARPTAAFAAAGGGIVPDARWSDADEKIRQAGAERWNERCERFFVLYPEVKAGVPQVAGQRSSNLHGGKSLGSAPYDHQTKLLDACHKAKYGHKLP